MQVLLYNHLYINSRSNGKIVSYIQINNIAADEKE